MDFQIGSVAAVRYVPPEMHPSAVTEFPADLRYHELVYFIRSDVKMHLGAHTLETKDGSVVFLPRGHYGRYFTEKTVKCACIDIFFTSESPDLPKIPTLLLDAGGEFLRHCFDRALSAWKCRQPGYLLTAKAAIYSVFAGLEIKKEETYASERQLSKLQGSEKYLEKMLFSPDFSFRDLQAESGLGYTHFRNLFVKKYHTTPQKYVESRRLQYAKECLESGGCTVNEAAEAVGYHSVYYFSRVFKAEYGVPPSSFRKR